MTSSKSQNPNVNHYFSVNAESELNPFQIEVELGNRVCKVYSSKGVFSSNGVDKATASLLKFLKTDRAKKFLPEKTDSVLDLGCGWGAIALEIGMKFPLSKVRAVDINEKAVELTNLNAKELKLKNVVAKTSDDFDLSENGVKFDLIVSNPPIRIGKTQLFELLEKWMERLDENGVAFFVVQKNLGADSVVKWFNAKTSFSAEKISSSGGNSILFVH